MAVFQIRKPINEVYFGKTPGIKALIKQFSTFRQACRIYADPNDERYGTTKFINGPAINNKSELIEFNRMMENEFGFKSFALMIVPSSTKNLYTYPITLDFDVIGSTPKKNLTFAKDGFKYLRKAKFGVLVCITTDAFYDTDITDEELFAGIMHEVGHNFTSALSGNTMTLIGVRKFIHIMEVILNTVLNPNNAIGNLTNLAQNTSAVKRLRNAINDALSKNSFGRVFKSVCWTVGAVQQSIFDVIGDIAYFITTMAFLNPIVSILAGLTSGLSQLPATILGGVKDEQIADDFATMYGLGPELLSGLDKLTYGRHNSSVIRTIMDDCPFIGHMTNLLWMPCSIVNGLFDSHPTHAERYKNEIKYLKAELNKQGLDPKMRKEITTQIEEIEEQFDQTYRKFDENRDTHSFSKIWQAYLYDEFDGGGKSVFFAPPEDNHKEIDNAAKTAIPRKGSGGIVGKGLSNVKFK